MNKAYLIGFLVISVALGFALWALSSSMNPYVNLETARKMQSSVQLRGLILRDDSHPIYYDTQKNALRFWITDVLDKKEQSSPEHEIEVVYHGAKPDAFDSATGTAAHGRVSKEGEREVFVSDSMVIQCPSKYSEGKSPYKPDKKPAGGVS